MPITEYRYIPALGPADEPLAAPQPQKSRTWPVIANGSNPPIKPSHNQTHAFMTLQGRTVEVVRKPTPDISGEEIPVTELEAELRACDIKCNLLRKRLGIKPDNPAETRDDNSDSKPEAASSVFSDALTLDPAEKEELLEKLAIADGERANLAAEVRLQQLQIQKNARNKSFARANAQQASAAKIRKIEAQNGQLEAKDQLITTQKSALENRDGRIVALRTQVKDERQKNKAARTEATELSEAINYWKRLATRAEPSLEAAERLREEARTAERQAERKSNAAQAELNDMAKTLKDSTKKQQKELEVMRSERDQAIAERDKMKVALVGAQVAEKKIQIKLDEVKVVNTVRIKDFQDSQSAKVKKNVKKMEVVYTRSDEMNEMLANIRDHEKANANMLQKTVTQEHTIECLEIDIENEKAYTQQLKDHIDKLNDEQYIDRSMVDLLVQQMRRFDDLLEKFTDDKRLPIPVRVKIGHVLDEMKKTFVSARDAIYAEPDSDDESDIEAEEAANQQALQEALHAYKTAPIELELPQTRPDIREAKLM